MIDFTLIESAKGPKYTHSDNQKIGEIWLENLKCLQKLGGGVLTIQAHPGRISPNYIPGLIHFIENALKNNATFSTLGSVASKLD